MALSFHIGVGHGTTTCGADQRRTEAQAEICREFLKRRTRPSSPCRPTSASWRYFRAAPERHPGLKVVMAESHIGWIPCASSNASR